MAKPQKEEAANQVTHTEEADPCCSGNEHDDQCHPEHVLEQPRLDVV